MCKNVFKSLQELVMEEKYINHLCYKKRPETKRLTYLKALLQEILVYMYITVPRKCVYLCFEKVYNKKKNICTNCCLII